MCLKVLTSSFVKKQIKNLFTPSKFAKMVLLSIVNNRIKNQLNQLIELAVVVIKQVFKENGFRFLPKILEPVIAA